MSTQPVVTAQNNSPQTVANESNNLARAVTLRLVQGNVPPETAAKIGNIYGHAYLAYKNVGKDLWDVGKKGVYDGYQGGKKVLAAQKLLSGASQMSASGAVLGGMAVRRAVAGGDVLDSVTTVIEVVAKREDIPLNMCALSVSKVSLDGVTIVGGGLAFETGVGAVLAAMKVYAIQGDTRELIENCWPKDRGK